jgi:hypothetical protein
MDMEDSKAGVALLDLWRRWPLPVAVVSAAETGESRLAVLGPDLFALDDLSKLDFDKKICRAFVDPEAAAALCDPLGLDPVLVNPDLAGRAGKPEPDLIAVIEAARAARWRTVSGKMERARIEPLYDLDLFEMTRLAISGRLDQLLGAAKNNDKLARHVAYVLEGGDPTLVDCKLAPAPPNFSWFPQPHTPGLIRAAVFLHGKEQLPKAVIRALTQGVLVAQGRLDNKFGKKFASPSPRDWLPGKYHRDLRDDCVRFGTSSALFDIRIYRAEELREADDQVSCPAARPPSRATTKMLHALDGLKAEGKVRGGMPIVALYRLVLDRLGVKEEPPVGMKSESFRVGCRSWFIENKIISG